MGKLLVAVFSAVLLLAACMGSSGNQTASPEPTTAGADGLSPVPPQVLRVCHLAEATGSLPVLCPTRLPRATVGYPIQPPNALTARPIKGPEGRIEGIEFGYGAPYENQPRKNEPARFLHLAVLDGTSPLSQPAPNWERMGDRLVGGIKGELYRAPPYPEGGYHGDHFIFRWTRAGQSYAVSLHAWRTQETLQLLGAIVTGLRASSSIAVPPAVSPEVALVRVGREATDLAVGAGSVWVSRYLLRGRVVRLDWDSGAEVGRPLPVGRYPYRGIAVAGGSVWVANTDGNSLSWIDARKGRIVARRIPVGASPSAVDVGERYVWVANYEDGTVSRIDPRTGREEKPRIRVGAGPNGLDVAAGSVWVTDFDGPQLVRVDERTGEVVARIQAGDGLSDIEATEDGVWVTDFASDELLRIDPSTNSIASSIPVGPTPSGVAVSAGSVWVTDYWNGTVRRIDPDTGLELDRILVGGNLRRVAAEGSRVWVLNAAGRVAKVPIRESG
jgi:YVTN family beta-propeller protein